MIRLTASGMDRAERCTYWLRPDVQWPPETPSIYAAKGTALHDCVEHNGVRADGPVMALPEADQDEVLAWYEAWRNSPWSRVPWRHEVAFAWSRFEGAQEIGRGRASYTKAPWAEVAGTADLFHLSDDQEVLTLPDIKTGRQPERRRASESGQLATLAWLAFSSEYGALLREVRVAYVDVTEDGVTADQHTYPANWLAAQDARIERLIDSAPGSQPIAGAHCRYCPARPVCPAQAQEATALATFTPLTITRANAPTVLHRARAVGKFAESVESAAREVLREAGAAKVSDPDTGVTATLVESDVGEIDLAHPEARVILETFDVAKAIKTRESLTWADVKRAGGDRAKIERALQGVGAMKYASRPQWRTSDPNEAKPKRLPKETK